MNKESESERLLSVPAGGGTSEPEHISLGDLANQIGTGKVDIHSNGCGGTDADFRRKIAKSYTTDKALAALLELADDWAIRPRMVANGELEISPDENSLLTSKDARIAIKYLRQAVDREARHLAKENVRREAGRYTIEEAAEELATNTGLEVDRWRKTLLTEVKQGKLPLKNPDDYDRLPYPVPDDDVLLECEQVTTCDLNKLLESHAEWQVAYRFATGTAAAAKTMKTETKQQQWVGKFLRAISDLRLDPRALPAEKRGKPGVRSKIAKILGTTTTNKSFEHAWSRALKDGDIKYAENSK